MKLGKPAQITKDRRIKARHRASSLKVTIYRTGFKRWIYKPLELNCIDFNRYGTSIETTARFRRNERITMSFKGKYISQSNICGFISSRTKKDGLYRLGITFSNFTCSKEYSRQIDNALARIELLFNEHYRSSRT